MCSVCGSAGSSAFAPSSQCGRCPASLGSFLHRSGTHPVFLRTQGSARVPQASSRGWPHPGTRAPQEPTGLLLWTHLLPPPRPGLLRVSAPWSRLHLTACLHVVFGGECKAWCAAAFPREEPAWPTSLWGVRRSRPAAWLLVSAPV